MSVFWQFALGGLTGGSAYALMALGVVAVYKGSGILNFAQGAIGMFGGYVFWEVYSGGNGSLPLGISIAIGLLVGAGISISFYLAAARFLLNASDMAKVVAPLGLLLFLESVAAKIWGTQVQLIPPLFGQGSVTLFGGVISDDSLVVLVITLLVAVGLSLMFRRTRIGMNAAALRENSVAAGTIGISPHPTGITTWAVGGVLAAIAGIFLIPVIGLTPTTLTLLVVPAMASALIGRFSAIWTTVGVALGLGVVESILAGDYNVNQGIVSSVPFAVIIVAVMFGGRLLPGRGESLTIRLPKVGSGRIRPVKSVVLIGVAILIPALLSPTWSTAMTNGALFGLLALSMVVVTGYAGQISVAAAALAGFGSFVAAHCSSDWHLPFLVCVVLGTLSAVVLGTIFAAPAVRVRGVTLAIVTLGLSLAVEDMVLTQASITGNAQGLVIQSPSLFGFGVSPAAHPERFAIVCVVAFALGVFAVMNVRRGASGRRYLAVRANERGAASVGISVTGAKLGAFAVSAGLAGLSGALATFQFRVSDFSNYDVFQSITALAFTVVAGIGFVGGAILAAATSQGALLANFVSEVLNWTTVNDWIVILSGLFVIDVTIQYPDGVIVLMESQKKALIGRLPIGRSRRSATPREELATAPTPREEHEVPLVNLKRACSVSAGETLLIANDIRVAYGGVVAVDDVSLELTAGRVLGVIGPNGAGKTSLIDALSGYARLSGGTIRLQGRDVSRTRPFLRSRLGVGRTFQNLELFDDLSVRENLLTALDNHSRQAYVGDLVHPGKGSLNAAAMAAVEMLELGRDLGTTVGDLPQGRRRMVAIARLVAQEPSVILLDEPAAGLSGSERRTACDLFRALAGDLGAAVLLVEHNVDVVAATCQDLIVLEFGRVIASGPTATVLRSTTVRDAYLGQLDHRLEAQHP